MTAPSHLLSTSLLGDGDRCYRLLAGRDRRFDGVFYVGVTSTGIYCRPSCPARTPRRSDPLHDKDVGVSAQVSGTAVKGPWAALSRR